MNMDELKTFCVDNAGKMATGKNGKGANALTFSGRIIAYKLSTRAGAIILLEASNGEKNKRIPNPLPSIPFLVGEWMRVISDCNIGSPVLADTVSLGTTVKIDDKVIGVAQEVQASTQVTINKVCPHPECDTWCHRAYAGITEYAGLR